MKGAGNINFLVALVFFGAMFGVLFNYWVGAESKSCMESLNSTYVSTSEGSLNISFFNEEADKCKNAGYPFWVNLLFLVPIGIGIVAFWTPLVH